MRDEGGLAQGCKEVMIPKKVQRSEKDLGPDCTGSASLREQILEKSWKTPTKTWTAQDMIYSCKKGHEG